MRLRDKAMNLVAPVVLSPWVYAIVLLTVYFATKDLGSADQSQSALIGISAGENDQPLTALWFLSAMSLVAMPFVVLWQEQIINRIERTGFLTLLFSSSMTEASYRRSRISTALLLALILALASALICLLAVHHDATGQGWRWSRDLAIASLVVYLPNIVMASCIAAMLTRMGDRAIALAVGLATPVLWLAAVGMLAKTVKDPAVNVWLSALEPTATLYFSELSQLTTGAGWGDVRSGLWWPLLLNRGIVLTVSAFCVAVYLRAPSIFEESYGLIKTKRKPLAIFASQNFAPVFIGLIAGAIAASNLQSNFSKNLLFYQIKPDMAFLLSSALPGTQAPILAGILILSGKLVWDDRETGFHSLQSMSHLGGWGRLMRIVGRCLIAVAIFYGVVLMTISAMFLSNMKAMDPSAVLEYVCVQHIPGLLLSTFFFIFVIAAAPNRIVGYLASIGAMIAFIIFIDGGSGNQIPILPFPSVDPSYDQVLEVIAWPNGTRGAVFVRWGVALLIAAVSAPLLGRDTLRAREYVSNRDRRRAWWLVTPALFCLAIGMPLTLRSESSTGFLAPTQADAAQYERAALNSTARGQFKPVALTAKISVLPDEPVNLAIHYEIVRRKASSGYLQLTWALRPGAVKSVRVNGARANETWIAPGLLQLDVPDAESFSIDVDASMPAHSGPAPLLLSSLYGNWPTLPIVGVLPELFLSDDASRAKAGLPNFDNTLFDRFHPSGVSRPAIPFSISIIHACGQTVALPFKSKNTRTGNACVSEAGSNKPSRLELVAGVGHWKRNTQRDAFGLLTLLYPSKYEAQTNELLQSIINARYELKNIFGKPPASDLTFLMDHNYLLGSSNALSKPGLIIVSDVTVLDGALSGELRRQRETGLMAHEITHQWFGHMVRPKTGVPGAIFVNEMPAEFARAYAMRRRYGETGYRRYVTDQMSRYQYLLQTQSTPEGPAISTSVGDGIYARSMMLSDYLGQVFGWQEVAFRLTRFVERHTNNEAVTSRDLLDALIDGLDENEAHFARLLVETDIDFQIDRNTGLVTSVCHTSGCEADPLVPIQQPNVQNVEWRRLSNLKAGEIARSPIGRFLLEN